MPDLRSRRMARALARIVAVALSTAISLALLAVLAEAYFRSTQPPSYHPDPALTPDPVLGWNSVPPVSMLPLNSGAPAVYFLGDSFTDRKRWPGEVQRVLRDRGISIDGLNLGVSGYGTTQASMKLAQHVQSRSAAAVVLLFFAWNDLRDNYPYPELSYGPQRAARPYLVFDDGDWRLTPVTIGARLHARLLQTEVYQRIWHRAARKAQAVIVGRWPDLPTSLGWRAKIYYEEPVGWHAFYDPRHADTAYVQGAYATTIEAFRRIRDLAAEQHAPLLVIGIDNAFTVDAETAKQYLAPYPYLDPSLPLRRMGQLLAAEGIPFIDAQPALSALGRRTGAAVYDGPAGGLNLAGHLQPAADLLIGQIAADWLAGALAGRRHTQ